MEDEYEDMKKALIEAGHDPKLNEDGTLDVCVLEYDDPDSWGGHNGPGCLKCNAAWCVHCWNSHRIKVEPCTG